MWDWPELRDDGGPALRAEMEILYRSGQNLVSLSSTPGQQEKDIYSAANFDTLELW